MVSNGKKKRQQGHKNGEKDPTSLTRNVLSTTASIRTHIIRKLYGIIKM